MSVSSLTNGCKKATVELTCSQLLEIEAALAPHIEQLKEDFAFHPTKACQQCLLAANNALDLVRAALQEVR